MLVHFSMGLRAAFVEEVGQQMQAAALDHLRRHAAGAIAAAGRSIWSRRRRPFLSDVRACLPLLADYRRFLLSEDASPTAAAQEAQQWVRTALRLTSPTAER